MWTRCLGFPSARPCGRRMRSCSSRCGGGSWGGGGEGADRPPPPSVVVVDVPSGWDVDAGEPSPTSPSQPPPPPSASRAAATGVSGSAGADAADPAAPVAPAVANNPSGRDVLVSLSAPKRGTRAWRGAHYMGGRFVPRRLADALGIVLVPYEGDALVQRVQGGGGDNA